MATVDRPAVDVFLVAAGPEEPLAREIVRLGPSFGLHCAIDWDLAPMLTIEFDEIRQPLAECFAVFVVLTGARLSNRALTELGAAFGIEKPISVIVDDPGLAVPTTLARRPVFPANAIDEALAAVRTSRDDLLDAAARELAAALREVGVPAEQLPGNRRAIQSLGELFRSRTGKEVSAERLVSHALRLPRKLGDAARRPRGLAAANG